MVSWVHDNTCGLKDAFTVEMHWCARLSMLVMYILYKCVCVCELCLVVGTVVEGGSLWGCESCLLVDLCSLCL